MRPIRSNTIVNNSNNMEGMVIKTLQKLTM